MLIFDVQVECDGLVRLSGFYVGMKYDEMRSLILSKRVEIRETPGIEPNHTNITLCEFRSFEKYNKFYIQLEVYDDQFVSSIALGASPINNEELKNAQQDLSNLFLDIQRKSDLQPIDHWLQKLLGLKGEFISNKKYMVALQTERDEGFVLLSSSFVSGEMESTTKSSCSSSLNETIKEVNQQYKRLSKLFDLKQSLRFLVLAIVAYVISLLIMRCL